MAAALGYMAAAAAATAAGWERGNWWYCDVK
jgi:hypothetical protein